MHYRSALLTREQNRSKRWSGRLHGDGGPTSAFPHFTMLAAQELPGPLLLFSNLDPQYPGMVGMLAAAGALDQIGRVHGRAWGDVADPVVAARLDAHVRAGAAVRGLRGATFG